jgi:hypothetical protein
MPYQKPGKIGPALVRMLDTAPKALRFNGIEKIMRGSGCNKTHTYFPALMVNRGDYEAVNGR